MQQQSESDQSSNDLRNSVNWLYALANAHATCITMFIRCGFGTAVPGLSGVLAVVMMLLAVAQTNDIRMLWFFYAWIIALICQRLWTGILFLRGRREHSEYSGWPWLAMLFPTVRNETQAKNIEPVFCLLLGLLLGGFSPSVGGYVMFGVISLTVVRALQLAAVRRQVTAMRDLEIEQRAMSERMRGIRNDF